MVDRWLDRAWLLVPFVVSYISGKFDPVMVLDQVAPDRFSQTDYFSIYYRSVRLKDEMAVFVTLPESTLFLSLGRLTGEMRFSKRDLARLRNIHPVISPCASSIFTGVRRAAARRRAAASALRA